MPIYLGIAITIKTFTNIVSYRLCIKQSEGVFSLGRQVVKKVF